MLPYLYPQLPNRAYFGTPFFTKLDKDSRYIAEIKRNGWRMMAIKSDKQLGLWSRHKKLIKNTKNSDLSGIRSSLAYIPDDSMIDGELLDRRTKDIKDVYYVFDILYWGGKMLFQLPLWERREFLESVIKPNDHILLADQFMVGRKQLYLKALQQGDEGIVFKRRDMYYIANKIESKTNPTWIKVKKDEDHFVNQIA